MISREILTGFDILQRAFPKGKKYLAEDLQPVWRDLLSCSPLAFDRAVGSIVKGSRFLPTADYVLQRTLHMQRSIGQRVLPVPVEVDAGLQSLNLMRLRLKGVLPDGAYARELWAMSDQHIAASYAVEAWRVEQKMEG